MTGFDLAVAVFVVFGAAWGMWVGALKQIVMLLAWAAALAAPWFLAAPVGKALEKPLGVPYALSLAASAMGLSLLAYVAVRVLLSFPLRARKKQQEDGASIVGLGDRLGGGLMGVAKFGMVAWAVLSTSAVVAEPLAERGFKLGITESAFYRLSRDHNLWGIVFKERIARLKNAVAAAKAKAAKGVKTPLEDLSKDPRIQEIAKDVKLRAALEKGDVEALMRSSEVMSLVSDEDMLDKLAAALAVNADSLKLPRK